ncbi:MAG: multidrug effflux MFS transporter [Alphaproteobacteria bacterium]|nr:multidrug effflux MFS transporter [Alphaproteobacteria bacterium]
MQNEPSGAPDAPRAAPERTPLSLSVVLTACVAFGPISTDLYLPSLPALTKHFGADAASGQLTLSVFLAGFASGMLVYGPLADRFGRRPVLIGGIAVYILASIACALAPSMELLIAARFFQAIGACSGPVCARAMVRDLFARERAAQVFAYMATAMGLAPAIGPVIGAQLEVLLGWRANFWVLVAFGVCILAATLAVLPETNRHKNPQATRLVPLVTTYAGLLRHRDFVTFTAIMSLCYAVIFSWISGSSFVLIDLAQVSPQVYGLAFALMVVGYMSGTFTASRITRRFGIEGMIRIGTAVATLAGAAMLAINILAPPSFVGLAVPVAVATFGVGFVMPNAQAAAIAPFPRAAGAASAMLGFMQMAFGAAVGIAIGHGLGDSALPMVAAIQAASACAFLIALSLRRPASGAG